MPSERSRTIIVEPVAPSTAEVTMKTILNSGVSPKSLGIGIDNFFPLPDGRVIMEVPGDTRAEVIDIIVRNELLKDPGIQVNYPIERPKKGPPKLIFFNVPEGTDHEQFVIDIVAQN